YASVAGGDVAAAAEAADGEERLPEVGRAEVADGVREVRVVEHVDEEEREGHRVALLLSTAAANAAAEAGPLEDGYAAATATAACAASTTAAPAAFASATTTAAFASAATTSLTASVVALP